MRTKSLTKYVLSCAIAVLILTCCAFAGLNYATGAKADGKTDITDKIVLSDWETSWSSDTTQILILLNSGKLDKGAYINDNPNTFDIDLCQYLTVSVDGGAERTVREILNANQGGTTAYKGTNFPMSAGSLYSPVLLYVPANNDHIQIMVLKEFADQGHFDLRVKKGFYVTLNGVDCEITRDIVYGYASTGAWTPKFDVTIECGDETITQLVIKGLQPNLPTNVTKQSTATTDYTFTGWDKAPAAINEHTTYTAQFVESARKYSVTYLNEDGTTSDSVQVANGTHITEPAAPTKASTNEYEYTFDGWYTSEDVKWNFAQDNMPTADLTLKAKFTVSERKYRVAFTNEDGNPYEDSAYATQELGYNTAAVKPADPAKQSTAAQVFTFDGWYVGETEWDFTTPITEDVTLTAKFTAATRQYDVTVTFAGLDVQKQSVTKKVDYNGTVNLNEYAEEGYGFTATANGEPIGKSYTVTGDVTIAITYKIGEYSVAFTDEDGNPLEGGAYGAQTVQHNGTATKPADPVKQPTAAQVFTFDGWYVGETEWDFATCITEDVTLTAKFTAATRQYDVTVTFSGLNDEKQSVTEKADYNGTVDLSEYDEDGYSFTAIANGEAIDGKSYTVTGDVTIAITYKVGEYAVTFTVEGISVRPASVPDKVTVIQGQKLTLGNYSVLDYTYKIYKGEQEITGTELDLDGDISLRVVYTAVPDEGDDDPPPSGDNQGGNDKKKGCGSVAAGGSVAGGCALILAIGALLALRRRKIKE